MKLVRVARNLILAGIAWRLVAARRHKALARERRNRRIGRVLLAGGAGVVWATRPQILAGARRLLVAAKSRLDKNEQALHRGEPRSEPAQPQGSGEARAARHAGDTPGADERAPERAAPRTQGGEEHARSAHGRGNPGDAGASGPGRIEPKPSPKKRRQRARRAQAAQRQKAERESAHGGKVNVEVNKPEELRAPLGELKH